MGLWRYTAISLDATEQHPGAKSRMKPTRGEMASSSASEVRASLRAIGLQVVELSEVSPPQTTQRADESDGRLASALRSMATRALAMWHQHLRTRRKTQRADFFDGVASMLGAGLPLLEVIETAARETRSDRGSFRRMLLDVAGRIRDGSSCAEAFACHAAWFDPIEVATIGAGEDAGHLEDASASLAERLARADEFHHRLTGALIYPAVIVVVAVAVAVFLSIRTLPPLAQLLIDADVEVPRLTSAVIAGGHALIHFWFLLPVVFIGAIVPLLLLRRLIEGSELGQWFSELRTSMTPAFVRRHAVGLLLIELAYLLRSGLPLTDAIRTAAPTAPVRLRPALARAVDHIERGDAIADAFTDERWFGPEFRRLMHVAETTGDLHDMLDRLGNRHRRQATRFMERLVTLIEPATIVLLACGVGLIALAALLPILRLKEAIS